MKFIITADLHLSKYSNDKIDSLTYLPERLSSLKNTIYFIAEYAIRNNIEYIIIAGDIFHDKSTIYSLALNIFIQFLRNYNKIKFIIFSGNHDLSGKNNNVVSSLNCLSYEPNVIYISKPLKIEDILFVPYSHEMISFIKNNSSKYLISHFGLDEAVLSSGISIISDISIKDLENRYEKVFLGHYHKPQEVIRNNIEIFYVGSPIQLDWGERTEKKRFLIVDTKKSYIESILTEGYKKYYNFQLDNKNKEKIITEARKLKEQGHHVQLSQIEEIDNISDIYKEFNVINKTIKDITNRGITLNMSIEDRFKRYLEIKNISADEIDEYLKIGFEIVNSSIED